jgi:predicted  nucleic acid-binding Zn-ribbon protein
LNATIERLIALQDLLQLKRDLEDHSYEELGFETAGAGAIDAEIESLRNEIDPALLRRYDTIASKYERPLVPARKGICYGCFVRFPTAKLSQASDEPQTCENCGRLLYSVA